MSTISILRPARLPVLSLIATLFFVTVLLLFFSQGALAASRKEVAADQKVTFNFVDVELPTITKFISDITGKNFIFDDRLKGKITIIAPTKLSIEDAFSLFTSVLELKGFTIVPSGVNAYKVIPTADAKQRGLAISSERKPVNEGYAAQLIPLKNVSSDDVLRFIQPVVSKDGFVSAFGPGNMLLIIDSGTNIEKVLAIVDAIDQPAGRDAPEIIVLKSAGADNIVKVLNDGYAKARPSLAPGQPGYVEPAKAVADQRLNAVIVFGDRGSRESMKSLITLLDVPAPDAQARMNVYFLENADSTELVKVLEGIVRVAQPTRQAPAGGAPVAAFEAAASITITADKSSNALVVVASPADYQSLVQIIKQLDKRKRQVFVEAMIVEASLDKLTDYGSQWRATITKNGLPLLIGGFGQIDSSAVTSIVQGLQGASVGGMGNLLNIPVTQVGTDGTVNTTTLQVPGFAALFSLNEFKDFINVLSTPQLLTSDNKEAEIVVGDNVPYITNKQSGPVGTVSVFSQIERKDLGIILRITPQITEGDHVKLDVYEEISSLKQSQSDVELVTLGPTWTRRSTKTSVVVGDQQTIVIGGLIQEKEEKKIIKMPLLGDIPVLGWLFKTESTNKSRVNLLVFITPHIARDASTLNKLTTTKHREFSMAERMYVEGELLVKFREGVSQDQILKVILKQGATVISYNDQSSIYLLKLPKKVTTESAMDLYSSLPEVLSAEPNFTIKLQGTR